MRRLINLFVLALVFYKGKAGPISTLIYGGVEATPAEFPWLVSIQTPNIIGAGYTHICGGTLVTEDIIVTAAHCSKFIHMYPYNSIRVVAGAHRIDRQELGQQVAFIDQERVYIHKDYNGSTFEYDIAVIKISPAFQQTDTVKIVSLPSSNAESRGLCVVAGWGAHENGDDSNVLRKALVPVISKPECQRIYPENFRNESQICAGAPYVDNCYGDTGGALICANLGYSFFAGIASYGYFCGHPDHPGVYMETSHFISWIFNPNGINDPPEYEPTLPQDDSNEEPEPGTTLPTDSEEEDVETTLEPDSNEDSDPIDTTDTTDTTDPDAIDTFTVPQTATTKAASLTIAPTTSLTTEMPPTVPKDRPIHPNLEAPVEPCL